MENAEFVDINMEWAFESIAKRHSDPFSSNILDIKATNTRSDKIGSAKHLFNWNTGFYYSYNIRNANFTFEFKKNKYIFAQYKFKGIIGSCSPFKWNVDGSEDGINFYTLSHVNRSLCNAKSINENCVNETFSINKPMIVKFIRVVNTEGECFGEYFFFGLSAVDFYGYKINKKMSCINHNKKNQISSAFWIVLLYIEK